MPLGAPPPIRPSRAPRLFAICTHQTSDRTASNNSFACSAFSSLRSFTSVAAFSRGKPRSRRCSKQSENSFSIIASSGARSSSNSGLRLSCSTAAALAEAPA
eukprot:scaffold81970_cov22-Tisochrysis_lutea.AAC.4